MHKQKLKKPKESEWKGKLPRKRSVFALKTQQMLKPNVFARKNKQLKLNALDLQKRRLSVSVLKKKLQRKCALKKKLPKLNASNLKKKLQRKSNSRRRLPRLKESALRKKLLPNRN